MQEHVGNNQNSQEDRNRVRNFDIKNARSYFKPPVLSTTRTILLDGLIL